MAKIRKVVLAYSGGLDTTVALRWIGEKYDCEVVTFCSDVGQGEDLEGARAKALQFGATRAFVADQREEFVRDFVFPAVRAAAIYEAEYLLGTSLARPCIARGMMDIVRREGADAIAHGATGKGNDQVRFELAAYHFDPGIKIIAPWREWEFRGRGELLAWLHERNIPFEAELQKKYSVDRNLLHTSYEGGPLEDPWYEPDADTYFVARAPEQAPDAPRYVEIDFEEGNPVGVDGERLAPIELLTRLNEIGGEHAVGRVDLVENRYVGMKSRGVYETPGGYLLHRAHRAVESLTLDREAMRLRDDLVPRYATLVYNGFWYAPERIALQEMIDSMQRRVTGTARLKLYKGGVQVVGRKSPRSLYRSDVVTFEADEVYDQRDAAGFIRINSLRLRIQGEAEK